MHWSHHFLEMCVPVDIMNSETCSVYIDRSPTNLKIKYVLYLLDIIKQRHIGSVHVHKMIF